MPRSLQPQHVSLHVSQHAASTSDQLIHRQIVVKTPSVAAVTVPVSSAAGAVATAAVFGISYFGATSRSLHCTSQHVHCTRLSRCTARLQYLGMAEASAHTQSNCCCSTFSACLLCLPQSHPLCQPTSVLLSPAISVLALSNPLYMSVYHSANSVPDDDCYSQISCS